MKKILIVLFLIALVGCTSTQPITQNQFTDGPVKELVIDSHNWDFTQSDVTINKGDRVRVKVTSSSGVHGVAIPAFGVATGAVGPGQEEVIEFTADKSGSFDYFCNVPCGQGHRDMVRQIVVE